MFLATLPAISLRAATEKGRVLPAEAKRYLDPATEFPVELLTNPEHSSLLPYPYARSIGRKGVFFLFAADRGSGLQAFRYELRSGEIKCLTDAKSLAPGTLNLLPEDRQFAYVDGRSLFVSPLASLKERKVYEIPDGWELGEGFSVAGDGLYAALIEKQGAKSRLCLVGLARGNATTVVEHNGVLGHPQTRPRRAGILYQRDGALWLVNYDGQNNQKISSLACSAGAALWSPDGRTVAYLQAKDRSIALREATPDTQQDKLFAPTSQYGNFAQNPDGSVLCAASRSVAAPYVFAMLRSSRRELTLCEHKASDPATVAPIFSPTSQRIYFQSDRHGKPAIYSVVVDRFIEKTDT